MDISRIRLASSEIYPGTSISLLFLCIFFVGQTGAFVANFSRSSIHTQKKGHRIDPAGAEKQQALFVAFKTNVPSRRCFGSIRISHRWARRHRKLGPKKQRNAKNSKRSKIQSMQLSVAVCCFGFDFAHLCELKHCHEQAQLWPCTVGESTQPHPVIGLIPSERWWSACNRMMARSAAKIEGDRVGTWTYCHFQIIPQILHKHQPGILSWHYGSVSRRVYHQNWSHGAWS